MPATPDELTDRVCTQSCKQKGQDGLAGGEHNSQSAAATIPASTGLQVHELTGDIDTDGDAHSPADGCSWPDDDTHAVEGPSEQTPVSPTRRTIMKVVKVGVNLQMSINQFALAI
jgi:hypothetical protein